MNLHQAVVFAILMEGGNGIVGKSPGYIKEKLDACAGSSRPEALLDPINLRKFLRWRNLWRSERESMGSGSERPLRGGE